MNTYKIRATTYTRKYAGRANIYTVRQMRDSVQIHRLYVVCTSFDWEVYPVNYPDQIVVASTNVIYAHSNTYINAC